MRKLLGVAGPGVILFFLVLFASAHADDGASRVHALLIGIDRYQNDAWPPLTASQDVEALRQFFSEMKVPESNVKLLLNEDATADGILGAIQTLEKSVDKGDTAFIFYGGHGFVALDDDQEENDGLDECMVPSNALDPFDDVDAYGKTVVRDDEIEEAISRLVTIVRKDGDTNGSVILMFDSCHSGSMSRAAKLAPLKTRSGIPDALAMLRQKAATRSAGQTKKAEVGGIFSAPHKAGTEGWVIITACSSEETAKEAHEGGGIFTQSLIRILRDRAEQEVTYLGLIREVSATIRTQLDASQAQTPQVDGDQDLVLFKGITKPSNPNYVGIKSVEDDSHVTLQRGALDGLHPGTEVELYPASVRERDPGQLLATATIIDEDGSSLYAPAVLDKPVSETVLLGAKGWITKRAFGDRKAKLYFDSSDPWEGKAGELKAFLTTDQYAKEIVEVVSDPKSATLVAFSTDKARKPGTVELVRRQATSGSDETRRAALVSMPTNSPSVQDTFYREILRQAQADFLMRLETDGEGDVPAVGLNIRIGKSEILRNVAYPAFLEHAVKTFKEHPKTRGMTGLFQARKNDHAVLSVKNNSPDPLYITVLNVAPSGQVSVIYPRSQEMASSDSVAPGQEIPVFAGLEGAGVGSLERFRVIGTDKPYPLFLMNSSTSESARSRNVGANEPTPVAKVENPVGALIRGLPVPRARAYDPFQPPQVFHFSGVGEIEMTR